MTARMHTQDAAVQMSGLNTVQRSLRLILQDKLTPTQCRRLSLLFGLDGGAALSLRQAGRAEGVTQQAVFQARDLAIRKLQDDWRLWSFWLLWESPLLDDCNGVEEPLHLQDQGAATRTHAAKSLDGPRTQILKQPLAGPGDISAVDFNDWDGYSAHKPQMNSHDWESDRYNAPTAEEAYTDGWIAHNENVPKSENPYHGDTQHEAWDRGWDDAHSGIRAP